MTGITLEQKPLILSLLFFTAFAVYLFLGIYTLQTNPKAGTNKAFFALCLSLCFWSLGFSIAISAPTREICLYGRRISAVGWGTVYSVLLHFLLLLSGKTCSEKGRKLCFLLYLPAAVSVYAFAFSNRITATQFNLVKAACGWINIAVQNRWTTFFNIYYLAYALASRIIIWHWRNSAETPSARKQANTLLLAIAAALLLGSLTDVILSKALHGSLPQMAPLFTLIPIATTYYSMKRFSLMPEADVMEKDLVFDSEIRKQFYYYLALSFFAGGLIISLAYYLPHLVNSEKSLKTMLIVGRTFFILGTATFICQLFENERVKENLVIAVMLCSIPLITLPFVKYGSVTIWAFPAAMMIAVLIFGTRLPLVLLTIASVFIQLIVWLYAPKGTVQLDEIDYIMRACFFIVLFFIGAYVNRTYIRRLNENIYQVNFQKLISEISFDFISVNQRNLGEKIDVMLDKIGRFFHVDLAYVLTIDHQQNILNSAYKWCSEGITAKVEPAHGIPIDANTWWMKQLGKNKLIYIADVGTLPKSASLEKKELNKRGVKSLVAIPIEENEVMLGFMGLESVSTFKKWTRDHIGMLRILSNLLADGLIKVKSEQAIEYMAYYDNLTGLPNRTLFMDRLTQAIHLANRKQRYIGVIFLDLDDFKMVNDTMGHRGGDAILKAVAWKLVQQVRKTDTVARFGGDEFLIMINDLKDDKDITTVVDHIIGTFKHPFGVCGQELFITGSMGIALYPFDGEDPETLIKNADIAMYRAKSRGKSHYQLCTPVIKEEVKKNIKLSNNLYRVQERDELLIYYQPQIMLSTGQIIGVEALLRWNHPEMGMILPDIFIPLAEMNGTINAIGEWVLKEAVSQNKKWQDKGLPHLRMAVNLSIIQFNNPNFVGRVVRILKEAALDPKYLELEITESIAAKDAAHITDALNKFKQVGISISIDDFGTEYSSFNRLKMLPINRIKIDMSFIQGITGNEKDRAITKIIINLAKSLGMEVTAEGVETTQQLEFLNQRLCDIAQGYYYFKPMPAAEIEKLLRNFKTG